MVRLTQLAALLFVVSTALFFLLRLAGDPARVLAGENASEDTLAEVRERYGFDRSLVGQYLVFVGQLARLDFGASLFSGQNALGVALGRVPVTLQLAAMAIVVTGVVAVPLGAWLGARPTGTVRAGASFGVSVAQGIPGYVVGLLLIQLLAVELRWLPSIAGGGAGSGVLPTLTLAAFLVPQMTRVVAAGVGEAMEQDYVRTALANGAGRAVVLTRHAVPNALLAVTALLGSQFAFLLSGAVVTEFIFSWPGLGLLLVRSVTTLDFPLVQAAVFVVAVLVFVVNLLIDVILQLVDPRLRRRSQ